MQKTAMNKKAKWDKDYQICILYMHLRLDIRFLLIYGVFNALLNAKLSFFNCKIYAVVYFNEWDLGIIWICATCYFNIQFFIY